MLSPFVYVIVSPEIDNPLIYPEELASNFALFSVFDAYVVVIVFPLPSFSADSAVETESLIFTY